MNHQELADRLVVATEEQDVLYVLYWLSEMKEMNCLREAINNKHSWKGCSALESIVKSPLTQLRRVILELLLLRGTKIQTEAESSINENREALQVLMNWESSGKQAARDARHLLSVSLEEAGEWIDTNLEPPPNASSLTGCGDPPSRPPSCSLLSTTLTDTVTNQPESASKPPSISPDLPSRSNSPTPRTRSPSPNYRFSRLDPTYLKPTGVPSSPSVDPRSRFSERFRTIIPVTFPLFQYSPPRHLTQPSSYLPTPPVSRETSTSIASTSSNSSTSSSTTMTRLNFSFLPTYFAAADLKTLFTDIKVDCQVILCHTSYLPTYAFVDVPSDQVQLALGALHGKTVQGSKISCKRFTPLSLRAPHAEPRFAPIPQGHHTRTLPTPFAASHNSELSKPKPISQQTHHLKVQDSNRVSPGKSPVKRSRKSESRDTKEDWDEGEEKERKRLRR